MLNKHDYVDMMTDTENERYCVFVFMTDIVSDTSIFSSVLKDIFSIFLKSEGRINTLLSRADYGAVSP